MDAEQLREVIMLAEKKNYAVAAEQLFISQSALSRHVSQLEDKLGVRLFDRSPRKVSLTRYGEALLPYARDIIFVEDACMEVLDQLRSEELNRVRLGCVHGLSAYGVMRLIAGFIAEHKDISLSVEHSDNNALKEMLEQGKADVVIAYDLTDENNNSSKSLTLCEDRIVAVVPADHLLASRRILSIKDLGRTECIIQEDDRFMNRILSDIIRGSGVSIKKAPVNISGVGPVELAAQGLGMAFEFEKIAKKHDQEGIKLIPIESAKKVRLELIWPKKTGEACSLFVSYIKNHIKKIRN